MRKIKLNCDRRQCLDCITRWNSTHHMLDRALECKEAFSSFHLVDSFKNPPLEEDWQVAEELCKFLKVFDDSTNIFSATSTPTSKLYFFQACKITLHLRSTWDDPVITKMQVGRIDKFQQYWRDHSMILSIVVIFDPRCKFEFFGIMSKEGVRWICWYAY